MRAIPLAQVSLYAAMRRGRSVPHAPCGARALTGHPHPILAQADPVREVKQRLSDRFQAQGARGRERVTTARSDTTAAVTIAYLSPAQGLLRRRRHGPLVDEAQVQTCYGSSQDIIGATETGYLLFYEAVEWGSFGDPPTSTPPHGG